jgi:hypothetical protein
MLLFDLRYLFRPLMQGQRRSMPSGAIHQQNLRYRVHSRQLRAIVPTHNYVVLERTVCRKAARGTGESEKTEKVYQFQKSIRQPCLSIVFLQENMVQRSSAKSP